MLNKLREKFFHKSAGIDGILVTVGLCIIALVLCLVMKDQLRTLVVDIVTALQGKAEGILDGTTKTPTSTIFFKGLRFW
jgi:hypothetical protein